MFFQIKIILILKKSFESFKIIAQQISSRIDKIGQLKDIPLSERTAEEKKLLKDLIKERRETEGEMREQKRFTGSELEEFRKFEKIEAKKIAKERGIPIKEANEIARQILELELGDKPRLGRPFANPEAQAKRMEKVEK